MAGTGEPGTRATNSAAAEDGQEPAQHAATRTAGRRSCGLGWAERLPPLPHLPGRRPRRNVSAGPRPRPAAPTRAVVRQRRGGRRCRSAPARAHPRTPAHTRGERARGLCRGLGGTPARPRLVGLGGSATPSAASEIPARCPRANPQGCSCLDTSAPATPTPEMPRSSQCPSAILAAGPAPLPRHVMAPAWATWKLLLSRPRHRPLPHPGAGGDPAAATARRGREWPPTEDDDNTVRHQKRSRTTFNLEQVQELEKVFAKQHSVVGKKRAQLAARLNLTENQVRVWFQNRRVKYYKELKLQAIPACLDEPSSSSDATVQSEDIQAGVDN
ncbi:homeobox protein notochord [Ochotona princeps]|uniref:homeobox protein notochord n=1 Tax=Ochotona princeps TaxID=9978 RepID=UPI0027151888|nr:homeobox protein notochord [Ochotona princeps]